MKFFFFATVLASTLASTSCKPQEQNTGETAGTGQVVARKVIEGGVFTLGWGAKNVVKWWCAGDADKVHTVPAAEWPALWEEMKKNEMDVCPEKMFSWEGIVQVERATAPKLDNIEAWKSICASAEQKHCMFPSYLNTTVTQVLKSEDIMDTSNKASRWSLYRLIGTSVRPSTKAIGGPAGG